VCCACGMAVRACVADGTGQFDQYTCPLLYRQQQVELLCVLRTGGVSTREAQGWEGCSSSA
jgi:hypothetical protein